MRFVTPLSWILTFFVLLFVYTKFLGPIPFSVNSLVTQKSDTFQATGVGKASTRPDIATVTVGVTAQGSTVKTAQDQLNNSINKVSSSIINNLLVDQEDIKTTNYNIHPDYNFTVGNQKISGYTANANLSVKVRNIDKVNAVIDSASENGANQIGGINFDIDDKTKYENEARGKAVEEAKNRAEHAANIAGFKLGKIINYSENFGGGSLPIPLRATADAKTDVVTDTQIAPGSSEVTVIVTLSYEIR